jgi:hypothetical protein
LCHIEVATKSGVGDVAVDILSTVDVESEILAALRALEADYQKNGQQWRCPSNPSDPKIQGSGNIIGSEALLCFLLPLSALRDQQVFQQKVFEVVSKKALCERVESHLLVHKNRADFTGHPYTLIVDFERKTHPFIDSYCFIISILVLYAEIFGTPGNKATLEHFRFLFRTCLESLKNSAVKGTAGHYAGFFATDKYLPEVPFKYPTWMAIDTLSDLRVLDDVSALPFATNESTRDATLLLDNILPDVRDEYRRVYIDGELTAKEKELIKNRNVDLTVDIIREDEDDNSPHYNLWAAIIFLHLNYNDTDKLAAAFKILMPYIDDTRKFGRITNDPCKISFFSDRFPPGEAIENVITDRCFLPQYVKGLSLLLKNVPRLRTEEPFTKSLGKSIAALLKNRKKDVSLWDRFSERQAPYAIYQTERAIEALCALVNLRATVLSEEIDTAAQQWPAQRFDAGLVDAVLRHAIVIRVGEEDARSIIAREISNQFEKVRAGLLQVLEQMAITIDGHLAQAENAEQTPSQDLKSQIMVWAKEAGMIKD